MSRRPLIGIEADVAVSDTGKRFARVNEAYYQAVSASGGRPVLLPPLATEEHVKDALELVDALVFPGGDDIPAAEYAQSPLETCPRFKPIDSTRYRFGLELLRAAVRAKKPLLGVCYGHQLLNVALGGDMVQDIPMLLPQAEEHRSHEGKDAEHDVAIDEGTRLAEVVGGTSARVNSSHHQSVRKPGIGLRVAARSPDGVIEAVESAEDGRFLVGVQWHPERMGPGRAGWGVFQALVEAARGAR